MSTLSPPAAIIPWMLNLATRTLAHSLNMPEPLLHTTGRPSCSRKCRRSKNSIGKRLCPIRLLRQLLATCAATRRADPTTDPPP